MKTFLNWMSFVSVLLALGVTILILFWEFWPYKTLEFKQDKFPIINKTIHAGDLLFYSVDYCKYTDLPALVARHIVNGYDYTMTPTVTDRPVGCHSVIISFILPKETPPGKGYHADMIYQYQVNPLRTILIKHSTENFEVLEATASAF